MPPKRKMCWGIDWGKDFEVCTQADECKPEEPARREARGWRWVAICEATGRIGAMGVSLYRAWTSPRDGAGAVARYIAQGGARNGR